MSKDKAIIEPVYRLTWQKFGSLLDVAHIESGSSVVVCDEILLEEILLTLEENEAENLGLPERPQTKTATDMSFLFATGDL